MAAIGGLLSATFILIVARHAGPNLVNLRVHELRDVIGQGAALRFWTDEIAVGDGRNAHFANLVSQRVETGEAGRPKAIWAPIVTREWPQLTDVDGLRGDLRRRFGEEAAVWVGGGFIRRGDNVGGHRLLHRDPRGTASALLLPWPAEAEYKVADGEFDETKASRPRRCPRLVRGGKRQASGGS
jgi:hypothetical protein